MPEFVLRPIKKPISDAGQPFNGPKKHSNESKFKMTLVLEHLFSNLTSDEVSKRCHFSLEFFFS